MPTLELVYSSGGIAGTAQLNSVAQPLQWAPGTSQWMHSQGTIPPTNTSALQQQVHPYPPPSLQIGTAQPTHQFPYFLPHVSKEMINKEHYPPMIAVV